MRPLDMRRFTRLPHTHESILIVQDTGLFALHIFWERNSLLLIGFEDKVAGFFCFFCLIIAVISLLIQFPWCHNKFCQCFLLYLLKILLLGRHMPEGWLREVLHLTDYCSKPLDGTSKRLLCHMKLLTGHRPIFSTHDCLNELVIVCIFREQCEKFGHDIYKPTCQFAENRPCSHQNYADAMLHQCKAKLVHHVMEAKTLVVVFDGLVEQ